MNTQMDSEAEPEALLAKAQGYKEQGDFDRAVEVYTDILRRYPDHARALETAYAHLGDIYLTLREMELTEAYLQKAIAYDPANIKYHYLLGFAYSVGRKWAKAIVEFEFCLKYQPEEPEYLRGMGWALWSSGRKPDGLAHLDRALERAPDSANILCDLASAHLLDLDFNQALGYAQHAVEVAPDNPVAKDVLTNVLLLQKQYREASRRQTAP